MSQKKWGNLKILILLLLIGATGGTLVWAGYLYYLTRQPVILPGVRVGSVIVGGLTPEEAKSRLSSYVRLIEEKKVVFILPEAQVEASLKDVGLVVDTATTLQNAYQVGRKGNLYQRWQDIQRARRGEREEPLVYRLDHEKLSSKLKDWCRNQIMAATDAALIVRGERVEVIPARPGVEVDVEQVARDLLKKIPDNQPLVVNVNLKQVMPRLTTEQVRAWGIEGLLSSFTTRFDTADLARSYNIKVAAAALNDLVLSPGEIFSFNRVVGPRSSEAGYKNARVIINNEFVEGIGGGVCQVSTTLYNAVLLACLEVVERSNHSLPVSYVPLGRDATVVYDSIDFKFRNNLPQHILIRTQVDNGSVTCSIYGPLSYRRKVTIRTWVTQEIEPQVIYEPDPNLRLGERVVKKEGAKGYRVAAERIVWDNTGSRRELLPVSFYQPVSRVIAVGTGEVEKGERVQPRPQPSPPAQPAVPLPPQPEPAQPVPPSSPPVPMPVPYQ